MAKFKKFIGKFENFRESVDFFAKLNHIKTFIASFRTFIASFRIFIANFEVFFNI